MTNRQNPTVTSFLISKNVTAKKLFSLINLTVSAKLVLRCLIDFWNYELGYAYPTQKTIAESTGLSDNTITSSVQELSEKNLVKKQRVNKRNFYIFTPKFWCHLQIIPPKFCIDIPKKWGNITPKNGDNNILKYKENTKNDFSFIDDFTKLNEMKIEFLNLPSNENRKPASAGELIEGVNGVNGVSEVNNEVSGEINNGINAENGDNEAPKTDIMSEADIMEEFNILKLQLKTYLKHAFRMDRANKIRERLKTMIKEYNIEDDEVDALL